MRLIKGTINVFLDTQVLESQQYDFGNTVLQRLIALKEANAIRLYSTEITRREIEKRLRERGQEVFQTIEKFRRNPLVRPLSLPLPEQTADSIGQRLLAGFQDYWRKLSVTEIPLSLGTLERVIDQYFATSPPFGAGDKKAEFPDAIAADAILAWCDGKEERMHIVSGDADWKAVCELNTKTLRYSQRLQELLALFPDPAFAHEIANAIREKEDSILEGLDLELLGAITEPVENELHFDFIALDNPRLGDIFILDAEGGCVTAQADIFFEFNANVRKKSSYTIRQFGRSKSLLDIDSGPYGRRACNGKGKATVELYAQYQDSDPADIEIEYNDMVIVSAEVEPIGFGFDADGTPHP